MTGLTRRLAGPCTVASMILIGSHAQGQSPLESAWARLEQGSASHNTDTRTRAVEALGLVAGNERVRKLLDARLTDEDPGVRAAAAISLGQVGLPSAVPALQKALADKDIDVVLSAASALVTLKDRSAYRIYYAVLTGQRKTGEPLLESQLNMLKDPDALTKIGFDAGIGFIPFGGAGYKLVKSFTQDKTSPVRAAAAQRLAADPDPASGKALAAASGDEKWLVRMSALEGRLRDEEEVVRFTAAAAFVRLSSAATKKSH
jgi:HEAT repeat protein